MNNKVIAHENLLPIIIMKSFEQQLENFKIKIKSFLRKAVATKHKVVFIEYTSTDCTKGLHQFPSAHAILSPFG